MTKLNRFKYLIIGSGRIAQHLSHYLRLLKESSVDTSQFSISSWDRSQDPHLLQSKLDDCTHVLLAITDSSLETFFQKNLVMLDKTIIHFSGALHIEGTISIHPLMSFGHELYELETYKKIHFALTGINELAEVFPMFQNSFTKIDAKDKALYHAYCVMSGNLPVILWTQILKELEKLDFPHEILDLYLSQVVSNFIQHKEKALTGPIARKDTVTIQKNIEALPQPEFQKIYKLFTEIPL